VQIRCRVALNLARWAHLAPILPAAQDVRWTLVVDLHIQAHETVVGCVLIVSWRVLWLYSILFVILIIHSVVKLSIIIQHVLAVNLFALVGEDQHVFGHEQVLNAVALEEVVRDVALRGVKGCQDHRFGRVVLYYRVLRRLQFLLEEWVIASPFPIFLLLIIILKVTDNFLLFVLGEHFNFLNLRSRQLHPGVN